VEHTNPLGNGEAFRNTSFSSSAKRKEGIITSGAKPPWWKNADKNGKEEDGEVWPGEVCLIKDNAASEASLKSRLSPTYDREDSRKGSALESQGRREASNEMWFVKSPSPF